MQDNSCVIFFERKIQGSALAVSYISLEEVILNKSLTRRKAISLVIRRISQIRKDLFSCRIPCWDSALQVAFCKQKRTVNRSSQRDLNMQLIKLDF